MISPHLTVKAEMIKATWKVLCMPEWLAWRSLVRNFVIYSFTDTWMWYFSPFIHFRYRSRMLRQAFLIQGLNANFSERDQWPVHSPGSSWNRTWAVVQVREHLLNQSDPMQFFCFQLMNFCSFRCPNMVFGLWTDKLGASYTAYCKIKRRRGQIYYKTLRRHHTIGVVGMKKNHGLIWTAYLWASGWFYGVSFRSWFFPVFSRPLTTTKNFGSSCQRPKRN
jgi:hypothetical protein